MRKTKEQHTKDKKLKTSHGITLIALIITIIVMIILVAVTVTMAVNGGLFSKAQTAGIKTNEAVALEQELGNGRIKIGGKWYDSPQDYVNNNPSANQGNGESEDETTEGGGYEFEEDEIDCSRCENTGRLIRVTCPETEEVILLKWIKDTTVVVCEQCPLKTSGSECGGCGSTIVNTDDFRFCATCNDYTVFDRIGSVM